MSSYQKVITRAVLQNRNKPKKRLLSMDKSEVEHLKTVGEAVLGVFLAAGAIALSAAAPNIFQVLGKISQIGRAGRRKYATPKEQGRKISKTISYLKTRGFVSIVSAGDDYIVKISQKGREKMFRAKFKNLSIPPKPAWDGKWWAVLADIPVGEKAKADYFRKKVRTLGLYPLQKSVWVYPFDPRDAVNFAAGYYKVDRFVTIMRIDVLEPEDESRLKNSFVFLKTCKNMIG